MDVSAVKPQPTQAARVTPSPDVISTADARRAVDLFTLVERLKTTRRTGWLRFGLERSESIGDHMYRMSIMAFVAGSLPGYDSSKCVKLAVIHDIAEAIVGDITPHCGVDKRDKHAREAAAITQMRSMLGAAAWEHAGEEMLALWHEYEAGASAEARLMKDLDKLEMILQAHEYEQRPAAPGEPPPQLAEFFASTDGKFNTPLGRALAAEVVERRTAAAAQSAAGSPAA